MSEENDDKVHLTDHDVYGCLTFIAFVWLCFAVAIRFGALYGGGAFFVFCAVMTFVNRPKP